MSISDNKWPSYANLKLGQKWRPGLFWAEIIAKTYVDGMCSTSLLWIVDTNTEIHSM